MTNTTGTPTQAGNFMVFTVGQVNHDACVDMTFVIDAFPDAVIRAEKGCGATVSVSVIVPQFWWKFAP